jgi:hypothetical protein
MLAEDGITIPLPNVQSNVMIKIIEYCNAVGDPNLPLIDLADGIADLGAAGATPWEVTFLTNLTSTELLDLQQASNYLDMPLLYNRTLAEKMRRDAVPQNED